MLSHVSIELLLDPESEAMVRADWDRLAAAGLSSLAPHKAPSNRPHVTLMVRPTLPLLGLGEVVARLPIVITLGEPMLFEHGDRGVLVRRVLPSQELLRLHGTLHSAVPPGEDALHTAPGDWTPHVTLARRLRVTEFSEAVSLVGPEHTGTGVSLRRWDSASAQVTALE